MSQDENINFDNKLQEYESRVLNLESILMKVENILDVSKYRDELHIIKDRYDYSNKENYSYDVDIQELDNLKKMIDDEVLPFYEIYLLTFNIESRINNIINDDIEDIIERTKKIIDILISINNYSSREVGYLINKAYRIIYHVIIHEEIFNRSDILEYINNLNISSVKENIGKLLLYDIMGFNQRDVNNDGFNNIIIEEDLKNINNEGLGYDYLNSDFIKMMSRKIINNKFLEYEERKKRDISLISSKINTFTKKNDSLINSLNKSNNQIKNLYINKSLLLSKALSIVLVPIITFSLGRTIGKSASNKITEYKTITRTVDLNTKNIIGDIEYVYDEVETTYVATVMECSPWRSNPSGIGYVRNVTAYECIVPKNAGEGYHITKEDLENNLLEKYTYIESKETLDRNDSTSDTTILLTETYQDKLDSRKSKKYIIPFSIVGGLTGIGIDVLLVFLGLYDIDRIRQLFDKLDREIKSSKLSNQEISDSLNTLMEDGRKLQDEYNSIVKKYGEFKIEEIKPLEELSSKKVNVKTRTKKKF